MRIVHYGLRIGALTALKNACVTVRTATDDNVAFDLIACTVPRFENACHASILILDLEHFPIGDAVSLVRKITVANPFLRTICIASTFIPAHEHAQLFQLGQLPGTRLIDVAVATTPHAWASIIDDTLELRAQQTFDRSVRLLIPADERGRIVLAMAEHARAPSVKRLVGRMYTDHAMSTESKRHRLWVECSRVALGAPEYILNALRVLLLKTLLDIAQWSNKKIAAYMGWNSVRNMGRSCRSRYGYSLSALEMTHHGVIHLTVMTPFWDGAPIKVVTEASSPRRLEALTSHKSGP